MNIFIPIFTVGEHTALNGIPRVFTEADLTATVNAYDPALFQAPVVLGHPEHNHPAWGWVKSLTFQEGTLWAELDQLDADFVEWVRQGRYKKVSASFYLPESPVNPAPGVLYLRHVGFLGAVAPSLKNLPAVALPVDLAETDGVDTFESANLMQSEQINHQEPLMTQNNSSEPSRDDQARLAAVEAENAVLKQQVAQFQEQAQQAQHDLQTQQRNALHEGHAAFCEKLVAEGRLLPASKEVYVAMLDTLAYMDTPLQYGEGDAKAPLTADVLKKTLADTPVLIPFGEAARDDGKTTAPAPLKIPAGYEVDPVAAELHNKALAYQESHTDCDYLTAVAAVSK